MVVKGKIGDIGVILYHVIYADVTEITIDELHSMSNSEIIFWCYT